MIDKRQKAWILFIAKLVFGLLLIALAFVWLDWEKLYAVISELDPSALALSAFVIMLFFVVAAVRWWLMVRYIAPAPFHSHIAIYLGANLVNFFTPANLGGDAYRVMALRDSGPTGALITALLQERVIGLLGYLASFLLCYPALLWLLPDLQSQPWHPANLMAFLALCALLLAPTTAWLAEHLSSIPGVIKRKKISKLIGYLGSVIRPGPPGLTSALYSLTILGVMLWILAVWIIARTVIPDIPFLAIGSVVIFAEIVRLIPLTVQGLGIRESAYAFGFALIGYDSETGFIVGLSAYLVLSVMLLLTGSVGWLLQLRNSAHGGTTTGR